jgi:hypothetical protein
MVGDLTQLAGYEAFCPGAIATDSSLHKKIEQNRKTFLASCKRAHELGFGVCLSTDEIQLPTVILDRLGKSVLLAEQPGRVDFESPAFWDLYRAKYREVLRAYPDIA